MSVEELVKFLRSAAQYFEERPTNGEDRAHWANVYNSENCDKAADKLEELAAALAERDKELKILRVDQKAYKEIIQHLTERAETAEAKNVIAGKALAEKDKEIAALRELIRWAHDTLYEINPSNYDHDEVCKLNDASVEVILGIAPTLGETHGYTKEWWAARNAGGNDAE